MISRLKNGKKVVGLKQTRKAIVAGAAAAVFLGRDADPAVLEPLSELCRGCGVPTDCSMTMRELGSVCGIRVGAACAAVLDP